MKAGINAIIVRGCGLLLLYALFVVAARLMSVHDFGVFSATISAATILAVLAEGGLGTYGTRTLASCRARTEYIGKLVPQLFCLGTLVWLVLLPLALIGYTLAVTTGRIAENFPHFAATVGIAGILSLVRIRQGISLSLFSAADAIFYEQLLLPAFFIILIVAASLAYGGKVDALTAALIYLAALAGSLTFGLARVAKDLNFSFNWAPRAFSLAIALRRYKKGLMLGLTRIVLTHNQQISIILVSFFLGFEGVALFAVAKRLADMVALPLGMGGMMAMPRFARAKNDNAVLNSEARFVCSWVTVVTLLLVVLMVIARDPILGLFGEEYRNAGALFLILLAGQTINSLTGPSGIILQMIHKERYFLAILLGQAVGLIVAVPLAAHFGGILWAAGALSLVVIIGNLVAMAYLYRSNNVILLPNWKFRPEASGP